MCGCPHGTLIVRILDCKQDGLCCLHVQHPAYRGHPMQVCAGPIGPGCDLRLKLPGHVQCMRPGVGATLVSSSRINRPSQVSKNIWSVGAADITSEHLTNSRRHSIGISFVQQLNFRLWKLAHCTAGLNGFD